MAVQVTEQELGELRWLVVRGPARQAGEHSPLDWRTNHGRYVTGADVQRGGTSRSRARVLRAP